ncbi:hypothetical protein C8J56DRAFT_739163, partial [Mycena floridula]
DVEVAECMLAMEVMVDGKLPRTASGVTEEQYNIEIKPVIAWMLEYCHPPGVQHWSSTTEFPTQTNKLGSTLNAFTHYSFKF